MEQLKEIKCLTITVYQPVALLLPYVTLSWICLHRAWRDKQSRVELMRWLLKSIGTAVDAVSLCTGCNTLNAFSQAQIICLHAKKFMQIQAVPVRPLHTYMA